MPETPATISPGRHLTLDVDDTIEARPDAIPPSTKHVLELLDFVHSWNQRRPMLVHCYAGISRSTAAAFIALCALYPVTPEGLIASSLRRSSDTTSPNRLFILIADKALGRDGRMIAAVNKMGPSKMAMECVPFAVPARQSGIRPPFHSARAEASAVG